MQLAHLPPFNPLKTLFFYDVASQLNSKTSVPFVYYDERCEDTTYGGAQTSVIRCGNVVVLTACLKVLKTLTESQNSLLNITGSDNRPQTTTIAHIYNTTKNTMHLMMAAPSGYINFSSPASLAVGDVLIGQIVWVAKN